MTQKAKDFETAIPVIIFKEGNKFVAHSPVIDVSSCGDTEEQARKRFAEATRIFFDELIEMGTLDEVLTECGWEKITENKSWAPPKVEYKEALVKIPAGG